MNYQITQVKSPDTIRICAEMMAASPPWSTLSFTIAQCEADLNHAALRVDAAVSEAGEILGFLASMALGIGFEPMIEYLCVSEANRNKGIGTKLISHFETTLFPQADNLYLFVSDINPRAMALYERKGYKRVGEMPDYNLPGQTEFIYRKSRRCKQG